MPRRLHGCRFGRQLGGYVTWLYIFIKVLYLLNVAGQFFLLNAFVGRSYGLWGYQVLKALVNGENWQVGVFHAIYLSFNILNLY
jgi:hypothetical protein